MTLIDGTLHPDDAAALADEISRWAAIARDRDDTTLLDRCRAAHRRGNEAPGLVWYVAWTDVLRQRQGIPAATRDQVADTLSILAGLVLHHSSGC